MRLFLALFFEQDNLMKLSTEIALLKQKYPQLRFECRERLHLTLWFYGDKVTPDLEHDIIKQLQQLQQLPNLTSFDLKLSTPLYLPNPLTPRAFAYEATSPHLLALLVKIEFLMQQIGLKRDRAFLPHISLARFPAKMRSLPDIKQLKFHTLSVTVKEVALLESILKPQGSEYLTKWKMRLT